MTELAVLEHQCILERIQTVKPEQHNVKLLTEPVPELFTLDMQNRSVESQDLTEKQMQAAETDSLNKNTVNYSQHIIVLTELAVLEP